MNAPQPGPSTTHAAVPPPTAMAAGAPPTMAAALTSPGTTMSAVRTQSASGQATTAAQGSPVSPATASTVSPATPLAYPGAYGPGYWRTPAAPGALPYAFHGGYPYYAYYPTMTYQYQQPAAYYPQPLSTYPQYAPPALAAADAPYVRPVDNDSDQDEDESEDDVEPATKRTRVDDAAAGPSGTSASSAVASTSVASAPPLPSTVRGAASLVRPAPPPAPAPAKSTLQKRPFYGSSEYYALRNQRREENRRKNKIKRQTKKEHAWRELENGAHASIGVFPPEVLDAIINVDNLPALRDHLALAATCRTFRSFYHDIVWQVLFYASFPDLCVPAWAVEVNYAPKYHASGAPDDLRSYLAAAVLRKTGSPVGPFARGWNAARHIFSSGAEGAPGCSRWNVSKAEWHAEHAGEAGHQYGATSDVAHLNNLRDAHTPYKVLIGVQYDPWPSEWRYLVARAVNEPLLTKTNAMGYFKLTSNELLTLSTVKPPTLRRKDLGPISKTYGGYRLSAVQALAYRAHGGPDGHASYLKSKRPTLGYWSYNPDRALELHRA